MTEISNFLFYIVSIVMIIMTVLVIFLPKTIHAVVCSVVVFVAATFLYFMLNAPFNAVCQLSIYAVGIALLLMFTISLINEKKEKIQKFEFKFHHLFGGAGVVLTGISFYLLLADDFKEFLLFDTNFSQAHTIEILNSTQIIGTNIFQNFVLSFELFSILLLVALIGVGVFFAQKERSK